MTRVLLIAISVIVLIMPSAAEADKPFHGVAAFSYFHIAAPLESLSNLTYEHFIIHLDEMADGSAHALTPRELLERIKSGTSVPNEVFLTFEGGYDDFYKTAYPALKERDLPAIVFLPVDMIGAQPGYMTWPQIAKIDDENSRVIFGISGCFHTDMTQMTKNELSGCLNRAIGQFKDKLGYRPKYFSLPYGIYDRTLLETLKVYNFDLIFGQASGVIPLKSTPPVLPRFPMTEPFGDPDRFLMIAGAGSIPAHNVNPPTALISNSENPPLVGFNVVSEITDLDQLHCFVSRQGRVNTELIGINRIEIRLKEKLQPGRHRLNCTLNHRTGDNHSPQMRWWGKILYIPEKR